ncbi:hypothetical protein [Telluribacter sp. SYSU D00476]|uniref:hypothetical protein n=1 Tax=Telluribacter sp. SYSU D00476 TaxID=2811430 RepID=UPI001FF2D284|nr:hypothetical protein [Telluribacter sp. SYSU D00476]
MSFSKPLVLVLLSILTLPLSYAQVPTLVFGGKQIRPGTKLQVLLPVVTDKDSTVIPVTVFRGAQKGPVLGITAGVHGWNMLLSWRRSSYPDNWSHSNQVIARCGCFIDVHAGILSF